VRQLGALAAHDAADEQQFPEARKS
jgi:hypothetical protein